MGGGAAVVGELVAVEGLAVVDGVAEPVEEDAAQRVAVDGVGPLGRVGDFWVHDRVFDDHQLAKVAAEEAEAATGAARGVQERLPLRSGRHARNDRLPAGLIASR